MRTVRTAALIAVLAGALAAPAQAAVRIGDETVVVTTPDARAEITRDPYRLRIETAAGRAALAHVDDRLQRPRRLPATRDPEPFHLEQEDDNATYAPLTFEVGGDERVQWNGSFWSGNLLYSRRAGTVHAARRVVSVRRTGAGVRLVLATTDRRRRIVVRVGPDRGGALRVRAAVTPSRGVMAIADSFAAGRREAFRGFGGRHSGLDQRGRKVYGWVEQENFGGPTITRTTGLLGAFVEQGTPFTLGQLRSRGADTGAWPGGEERYLFPGGPNGAYYVQNQFVSSRPYGFLLNRPELVRWRMATDRPDAWQVHVAAPALDYTVATGGPARAMAKLTAITGRHRLPPAWAQGATLWRAIQIDGSETAETYRAKIEADLAELERRRPPVTAYAFEGWALLGDPAYVRDVIRRLRALGARAILYVRAYVSYDLLRSQPAGDVEDVLARGLVARDARGRPYVYDANGAPGYVLDFTNPATQAWWRERLTSMLDLGADGFMQDFGEQVFEDMRFHDGRTGVELHNRYPVEFHALSRRIVDGYARARGRSEPVWFFTRAGFSGRPGSAAFEMGTFPGDETVDWGGASGLRSLAPDMLNRAIGGAFGYTTDIGGYADQITGPTSAELFTRWSEWAALTPYFRVHNSSFFGTRMPWSYDEATYARWVALAELHARFLPRIRGLWEEGRRTGVPPTRPLWLAAGDRAPTTAGREQQWMLGDDVVVAPVVEEGATSRTAWLPPGCWRLRGGGAALRGNRSVTVPAPLGELPWFVRCGARGY